MSTPAPTTTTTSSSSTLALPVAAIVCIAIGAYVVLIVLILAIRSVLLSRGICKESCQCCGKEDQPCCETCCNSLAECCACTQSPSLNACLDSICPSRKQMDFGDFVTCQCCSDPNNSCCGEASACKCGICECQCQPPECTDINCLCFKLNPTTSLPQDVDYDN